MSQFKVVITDFGIPDNDLEEAELSASGLDIALVRLNARSSEDLFPQVADADGLLVGFAQITSQVIDGLERCRVISRYGIGVDMIDLKAASRRGIIVANVPDYCIEEVSTSTIAFLLSLNRRIIAQNRLVHAGQWGYPPGEAAPARLSGQRLGLVGLGNIGRAVAQRARCLGLTVSADDPFVKQEDAGDLGIPLLSLDDLLRDSDYVSLHCPLTAATRHLIGPEQIALLKPTACLINMARGPVVDQQALYEALRDRRIAGAALDVLEQEPPAPGDPLLKLDNVLLSAHTASLSDQAIIQLRRDTARNVVLALQGLTPPSVVNAKDLGLSATRESEGSGR